MKSYLLNKTMILVSVNEIRQQGICQLHRTEQNGDFNEFSDELIEIAESKVSDMLNVINMIELDNVLKFSECEIYVLKQLKNIKLLKLALENHLNKCYNIIKLIKWVVKLQLKKRGRNNTCTLQLLMSAGIFF